MAGKKSVKSIGLVTICSRGDSLYLRFKVGGGYKFESAHTSDLAQAEEEAMKLHRSLSGETIRTSFAAVSIEEATCTAILRSRAKTDHHKRNQANFAKYFDAYMAEFWPTVRFWHEVESRHAEAYVDHLKQRKLSPKAIKHYVSILPQTARYWNNVDPVHYHAWRVVHPALTLPSEAKKNFVGLDVVRLLVARAMENNEHIAATGFILGGFCGMNLMEIAGVRVADVDLVNHVIRVNQAKTIYRPRTIPVAPIVSQHLTTIISKLDASVPWLITRREERKTETGKSYSTNVVQGEAYTLYKTMRRVVKSAIADAEENEQKEVAAALGSIAPKDMRKSFINAAVSAGVPFDWLRAYVGQAPASVLTAHYVNLSSIDALRAEVVDKVFGKVSKRKTARK